MGALDDDALDRRKVPPAQEDRTRNPDGVYSGMTKRNALSDGEFATVQDMPGDMRNRGRLPSDNEASGSRERS
jgi:hypothetical protein